MLVALLQSAGLSVHSNAWREMALPARRSSLGSLAALSCVQSAALCLILLAMVRPLSLSRVTLLVSAPSTCLGWTSATGSFPAVATSLALQLD